MLANNFVHLLFTISIIIFNSFQLSGFTFPIKTMSVSCLYASTAVPIDAEKSRLRLVVSGRPEYLESALFRAELKKELTFFRGCAGLCSLNKATQKLEIVGEGKTKQLIRFLEWLTTLTTELVNRKPTFQGPALKIAIESVLWQPFEGSIEGFATSTEAPLVSAETVVDTAKVEAKNIAGTDESV